MNHPYVFGFDQFYLPEDPDEHLAQGGLLLIAELRCAACHEAPPAWQEQLSPPPGPDLSEVGARLRTDSIWRFVRSPQHTKKGTLMPGLFTGAEGDAEDVEALAEYLASLRRSEPSSSTMPPGQPEQGKRLYHEVGCVACHEPATDYRPPAPPAGSELEKPGLPSVPILLAEAYTAEELSAFLQDPLHSRPAGRMPAQHLTAQEAADIATYLQAGETFVPSVERQVLQIPPQGVKRGHSVFQTRRCNACHQAGPSGPAQTADLDLPTLAALPPDRGCLTDDRRSGVPHYQLNPTQKRAIQASLVLIGNHADNPPPHDRLGWTLSQLNCYACHDRDGKGGPEDPRAQYFSTAPLPTTPGFHPYPVPRSLDRVGARLSADELQRSLRGQPKPGGATTLRMPDFGSENATQLFYRFRQKDSEATETN